MTTDQRTRVASVAADVGAMLDTVHEHLDRLRETVVGRVEPGRPVLRASAMTGIADVVGTLVGAVPWVGGAGFVAALDTVDKEHRYWSWWTRSSGIEAVARLHPPRGAADSAEYAYESMRWYRDGRDGRPSVFGPFVDFAGVNQLVILCSQPVQHDGQFLGVVGADLVMDRLEVPLVRLLRSVDGPAVLVGSTGRVVASTLTTLAPGDRFDAAGWAATPVDEGRAGWRLCTESGPR